MVELFREILTNTGNITLVLTCACGFSLAFIVGLAWYSGSRKNRK